METKIGRYSRSEYKIYSDEEFELLFSETMKLIFCDGPSTYYSINPFMPVFVERNWTTVALCGDLYSTYGCTQRVPDPIEHPDYDLHIRRDQLGPLWEILAEDKVDEVLVFSDFGKTHSTFGFEPNREAMNDVLFDEITFIGPGWLFDRTATWGVSAAMDSWCFLGGEPAMMKRFIEKAGGIGILQTRMKYKMSHYFSHEGKANEEWLNEWYRDYELMGWPWPYPVLPKGKPG